MADMSEHCNKCDIKGYCDKTPDKCPIAKEYKQIAEFEQAKAELKREIEKLFIKILDWLEDILKRIKLFL